MKPDDFELLARTVRDRSGIVLTADKAYLLESRLLPVARKFELKGLEGIVAELRRGGSPPLLRAITEAMTTNETLFFRDTKPFDQFRRVVIPHLLATRGAVRRVRVWCAACSSGQEPYSLAMVIDDEQARLGGWSFEILGTDINIEMVERGKAGAFSQFEVQRGLPIQMLMKHFKQIEDKWQISDRMRSMVQFREFNLLQDFRALGQFDIVFCRNVLIYFDQPTKTSILERIATIMSPDGVLYLGGAETVLGITDRFEPYPGERGLYRPAAQAAAKRAVG